LWTSSGALLASATFSSETASGWQQVMFGTAVRITANTTYVASYHTNVGHYSDDVFGFGRSGGDQSPLHALAEGVDGSNGLYAYGSSVFPAQSYQSSNYWVDVVFSTTSSDTTPPTVASVTPPAGATGVATTSAVTATFSDAMNPATISSTTFQLRDGVGNLVAATVTPGSPSTTATLTPSSALAASTTYTATITTGVKDVAGNAMASPYSWSFTTAAGGSACPCTIWNTSATPAVVAANDPNAVELGVRFRADQSGSITGIRFYKAAANAGTHVGNLWSNSGTLLATATFTNEASSGWQQVNFATPVSIAANTTYVASYHTNTGNYSVNGAYFATAGVDNGPLHALANGVDGANAVYAYSA